MSNFSKLLFCASLSVSALFVVGAVIQMLAGNYGWALADGAIVGFNIAAAILNYRSA
jgi:hypothetical protein